MNIALLASEDPIATPDGALSPLGTLARALAHAGCRVRLLAPLGAGREPALRVEGRLSVHLVAAPDAESFAPQRALGALAVEMARAVAQWADEGAIDAVEFAPEDALGAMTASLACLSGASRPALLAAVRVSPRLRDPRAARPACPRDLGPVTAALALASARLAHGRIAPDEDAAAWARDFYALPTPPDVAPWPRTWADHAAVEPRLRALRAAVAAARAPANPAPRDRLRLWTLLRDVGSASRHTRASALAALDAITEDAAA